MKIRLLGTVDECAAAVAALSSGFTDLAVSRAYPCRSDARQVRVYVDATPAARPTAGGGRP